MAHSFVAYIDESGDDGLGKFRQVGQRGGSSRWLVISACLFRQTHTLDAVAWRDEISARMPERNSRTLHFAKLNHGQKLAAVQTIASKPVRALSVIAAKEPIPEGVYTEKNQLYFYLTRYLIERLSWLCRDYRPMVPEGMVGSQLRSHAVAACPTMRSANTYCDLRLITAGRFGSLGRS